MTEKEFNEIKSLIIGLGGITEFKSTADRVDNALSILDRNKQLMLGGVVGRSEQLVCVCGKQKDEHSITTLLCHDRMGHFEAT